MRIVEPNSNEPSLKIVQPSMEVIQVSVEETVEKEDNTQKKDNLYEGMVNQMAHEIHNYCLYVIIASFYDRNGLQKLAKFFAKQASEELEHAQMLNNFLLEKNYPINSLNIPEANSEFKDLKDALKAFESTEKETTSLIKELYKISMKEGDVPAQSLLWDMLKEQVEEEKLASDSLHISEYSDDWLSIEDAIFNL